MAQMLGLLEMREQEGAMRSSLMKENVLYVFATADFLLNQLFLSHPLEICGWNLNDLVWRYI